ncbi:MAG: AbrB/MazE/SpoVT family DNA-binding domain-containing protein [Candidatus Woesearchaeota archaeon]
MIRKVNKIGPTTLMVSLPSEWVQSHGIKKGDELNVEINEEKLIIHNKKAPISYSWIIDAKNMDIEIIKRYVIAAYKLGVDIIEFQNTNTDIQKNVSSIVQRNILGFEIIQRSKTGFTLQSMHYEITHDFKDSLRRIFRLLIEMASDCESMLEKNNPDLFDSISELESNNNRLTNLVRRVLNKKGYIEKEKIVYAYLIIESLEKIADYYYDLASIITKESKINSSIIKYFHDINLQLTAIYTMSYSNYDTALVCSFVDAKRKLSQKGNKLLSSSTGVNNLILSIIAQINMRIFELLAPHVSLVIPLNHNIK